MCELEILLLIIGVTLVVAVFVFLWLLFNWEGICPFFTDNFTTRPDFEDDHNISQSLPLSPSSLKSKEEVNLQIKVFQENLRNDENQHETIQKVQSLLVSSKPLFADVNSLTLNSLIIAVDATPTTMGGYCINTFDRSLRFYVIRRKELPWLLYEANDAAEFEMKNLMFALTIWKNQILWFKRLFLYTDNFAMGGVLASKYGGITKQYLDHFVNCEKVTIVNQGRVAVNKNRDLKIFSKFIQPADDLSRWRIEKAILFLTEMYDIHIDNVDGTHEYKRIRRDDQSFASNHSRRWYEPTAYHNRILKSARKVIAKGLPCGNSICSSALQLSVRKSE
ncbi:unnamed protein product [Orchesella dallaii]|uniref:Reverse transcriptase RNase H-like domain-containing protein n=1 Tax=Orchesella dallaii TaxID=48710 RepID=A0ABP1PT00_9HEXA